MAILRGTRARFHGVLPDGCHPAVRDHLMRELDLAVVRHVARTRRAVAGGVRAKHYPVPERHGTLITAGPARTVPATRAEPGLPSDLPGAALWLLCIHRVHGRYADDGLAAFDDTCVLEVTVAPAVFTGLASTLLPSDTAIGDRLSWHGITIRPAASPGDDFPDRLSWARLGARARTGTAYLCPDDINFGLYLMFDTHRHQGMSAAEAAAEARAWLRSGQLGLPVFPWPIGEGRPFDVSRPAPVTPGRRRPRQLATARA